MSENEKNNINTDQTDEISTDVNAVDNTEVVSNDTKPDDSAKKSKRFKNPLNGVNKRKLKHGSMATAVTVFFVVGVVLVNLIVGSVDDAYPLKFDVTKDSKFQVSEETIDYISNIEKDVNITVLSDNITLSQSPNGKQVCEIIDRYAEHSKRINVTYIDADKNPETVAGLNNMYKGDLYNKLVVVESDGRVQALGEEDLLSYNQNENTQSYTVSSTAENAITSAVMNVTDSNPLTVTILTGGSTQDADFTPFAEVMSGNGYTVLESDALTGEIDPETDVIVLNSPMTDFTVAQVDKISAFLSNDGKYDRHLIYVASINQKPTPNIDALLAEYGLKVGAGYVMDTDMNNLTSLGGGIFGLYTFPDNEEIVKNLANPDLPVIATLSRPVEILFDAKGDRSTVSVLKTADTACVVPMDENQQQVDMDNLPQASYNLVASGKKVYYESSTPHTSSVTVIGSPLLIANTFTKNSSLNNGDYILAAINSLTGKGASFYVFPKNLTSKTFEITQAQAYAIRNVVVFIIPALIMVLGGIIWVRRRYR